jgi:membrane-associated phospholipid phosphatase
VSAERPSVHGCVARALLPFDYVAPLRALAATERLTLAYLAAMAVAAVLWHPEPLPLLARFGALAAAIVGAAAIGSRSTAGRIVRDFLPIVSMACIFNWTGPVIAATHDAPWDAALADMDRALFTTVRDGWFGLLGRPLWLTDAASLAYVSYYFVPVVMAVALYVTDRRADFERLVLTVVTALLVTYVSYFALPASGPRVPPAEEASVLGGSAISSVIRTALRFAEGNLLDAFPSGHTTVSLVYLACGWRLFPRWRVPLVLAVAGIVFSTVYLSLHYVIDVVAGVLLAAALPFLLPALQRWASPTPSLARPPQRPSSIALQRRPNHPIRSNRPSR